MKALILAAGMGKRLLPVTKDLPKCLVKIGQKTILEYLLDCIVYAGIKETIIVVGFKKELVQKTIGDSYKGMKIKYAVNDFFGTTNNLYSLWCARDLIDDAFIQCHGDIILNKEIIKRIVESPLKDAIVVDSDPQNIIEDANKVKIKDGRIIEINKILSKKESVGRAFGIYKFSKKSAKEYYKHIEANIDKINDGFETGLRPLIKERSFQIIDVQGFPFAEIDDINDLTGAKEKIDYILGNKILNLKEIGNIKLRNKALEILTAGVDNVMPGKILPKYVSYKNGKLKVKQEEFDLNKGKVYVLGCGKASGLMAQVLENIIPLEKITAGIVNSIKKLPTKKIIINEAGHPIPDKRGLDGVKIMLDIVKNLTEEDIVICLLSGGGSALLPDPPEMIRLDDIQEMTKLLIKSGAETYEINIIRKHISKLKGGNLAKILQPAKIISLIISDDLDGREDTASRPTAYEESTFQDAYKILEKYELIEKIPGSIKDYLGKGLRGEVPENPKKGEPFLENVHNYILADNKTALNAMQEKAKSFGFKTYMIDETIKGETKMSAKKIGKFFQEKYNNENIPIAVLYGSETVVTVKGKGKGGRIQEFVASLIDEISGQKNSVIAAIGSDGIDFIPGIGGAIADDKTYDMLKKIGLDINKFLEDNDSYSLHQILGNLILMEPTHTNVGDLHVYLQEKEL